MRFVRRGTSSRPGLLIVPSAVPFSTSVMFASMRVPRFFMFWSDTGISLAVPYASATLLPLLGALTGLFEPPSMLQPDAANMRARITNGVRYRVMRADQAHVRPGAQSPTNARTRVRARAVGSVRGCTCTRGVTVTDVAPD